MAAWLGCPVNMADIRHRIGAIFAEVFDIQWDKVLLGVDVHEAPDRRMSDLDRTLVVKSSSPQGV
jgi:hypothetical protein